MLVTQLLGYAQPLSSTLQKAVQQLQAEPELKHAIVGIYVLNLTTGEPVFAQHAETGLVPASTQKIITSASAFELLGSQFRYRTKIGTSGSTLEVEGSGDPSLGSWRWEGTKSRHLYDQITAALKAKNIQQIQLPFLFKTPSWETPATARGYTWEDIGNYYGAAAMGFNWNENQYSLTLQPGKKVGDPVAIVNMIPASGGSFSLINQLKTGPVASGDLSVIYAAEGSRIGHVTGTVPGGNATFTIKGSMPDPTAFFKKGLEDALVQNGIALKESQLATTSAKPPALEPLLEIVSPTFDSLNHWFMRESINLYGEAFLKTIARQQKQVAATDSGLAVIRYFWSTRGIDKSALRILDGSGLSPANRVTPAALVRVLQYASTRPWYNQFYQALPTINGIKMKSGYINGVRSYAGYIKRNTGEIYAFALIINNFDGSASTMRQKMFTLISLLQ